MEDNLDIRKTRYKQMSTQELLKLHAAGILSSILYDVLESELRERGVAVPSRPKGEKTSAEVDSTQNYEEKRKCKYATWSWKLPLIGFILLLVTFAAKRFLIATVPLFLVSILAGALLTSWAFVERKRYSNAKKHAIIGLTVNGILIILTAIAYTLLVFVAMGMSGKFGY